MPLTVATPPPPRAIFLLPPEQGDQVPVNAGLVFAMVSTAQPASVTVTPQGGSPLAGSVASRAGDLFAWLPDVDLAPKTTHTIEVDTGVSQVVSTTTFTTGSQTDSDTPSAPSAVAWEFQDYYDHEADPLPGEFQSHWDLVLTWSPSLDSHRIVYGVNVNGDAAWGETGSTYHTSDTNLTVPMALTQTIAVSVCGSDEGGREICSSQQQITVPGVPEEEADVGGCSCRLDARPRPGGVAVVVLVGFAAFAVRRRRRRT